MSHFQESGGVIDSEYLHQHNVKFIIDSFKYCFNDNTQRDHIFHNEYRLNMLVFFHLTNKGVVPVGRVNDAKYTSWDLDADTRLNTGLIAIIDILHLDIKQLYIKGFSFFKDGYINDYRKLSNNINDLHSSNAVNKRLNASGNHDQKKQWVLFKKILLDLKIKDKLIMDSTLYEIMRLSDDDF